MAIVVLDCTVIMRWVLKEDDVASSVDILERVAQYGALVPAIWALEIGNVLLTNVRHKRLNPQNIKSALADISELRIDVDRRTHDLAWTRTLSLAQRHNLTTYDASYLELAARNGLALATLDRALVKAAESEGMLVLPT